MQRILFHSNHLQESRTSALNCGLVKWDFFWSSWGHVQTKFWENAVPHRYVLENMHTGPRQSSDRNVHHKLLCQTPLGMTLRAAYWTVEKAKCGKTAIMAERKFVYLLVTALSCSESGPNTKKKQTKDNEVCSSIHSNTTFSLGYYLESVFTARFKAPERWIREQYQKRNPVTHFPNTAKMEFPSVTHNADFMWMWGQNAGGEKRTLKEIQKCERRTFTLRLC